MLLRTTEILIIFISTLISNRSVPMHSSKVRFLIFYSGKLTLLKPFLTVRLALRILNALLFTIQKDIMIALTEISAGKNMKASII